MFEWLHHHDSPDLEHAKERQHERDLSQKHKDPLAEYEVIATDGLVVEELPVAEANKLLHEAALPKKVKAQNSRQ